MILPAKHPRCPSAASGSNSLYPTGIPRQRSIDRAGYRVGRVVCPEPQDSPAGRFERSRLFAIPFDVALQLRRPILAIHLRPLTVLWAAMPETSVHEDRDFALCEDDVRTDEPPVDTNREVLPEAIAKAMKRGAQGDLGRGIGTPDCGHVARSARRCCVAGQRRRGSAMFARHTTNLRRC